jgi:hypothetical protein
MSPLSSAPARSSFRSAVAPVLLTLAVVGCAGRGDVSGKVSYQGKPVVFGSVQFEASDKTIKQANIKEDGTYSIAGVPVGEAKVAVSSQNPQSSDFQRLHRGENQPPPKPRPAIPGWFPIPTDYQDLSKAKLTFTVKRGQNPYDIDLK